MLTWGHEEPEFNIDPPCRHPGAVVGLGRHGSWRGSGVKDRGVVTDPGGATSRMDRRSLGPNPDEPQPLDSRGKRCRGRSLATQAETGAPLSANAPAAGRSREGFG